jgi:hypothetical protein
LNKICKKCKQEQPLCEYSFDFEAAKFKETCNTCTANKIKEKKKELTKEENQRLANYCYNYNITTEEYYKLEESQHFLCSICKKPTPNKFFCVDHDHKTSNVRGLLCKNCNLGLGHFKDDISVMSSAIEYISKSKEYQVNGINLKRK